MSRTKEIEHRIERLRQKKKQIEKSQALALYKNIQQLMKEEFSAELVEAILIETWTHATPEKKEIWHNNAASFRKPSKTKTAKKNTEA